MTAEFVFVVQGHIDQDWDKFFEGFRFEHLPDGTTLLRGIVVDQPALHSLLMRINMLGWTLLKVEQIKQVG